MKIKNKTELTRNKTITNLLIFCNRISRRYDFITKSQIKKNGYDLLVYIKDKKITIPIRLTFKYDDKEKVGYPLKYTLIYKRKFYESSSFKKIIKRIDRYIGEEIGKIKKEKHNHSRSS